MNQLYPFIRRVRRPLVAPATPEAVPPPAPARPATTSNPSPPVAPPPAAEGSTAPLLELAAEPATPAETSAPPKGTKPCPKKPSAH